MWKGKKGFYLHAILYANFQICQRNTFIEDGFIYACQSIVLSKYKSKTLCSYMIIKEIENSR